MGPCILLVAIVVQVLQKREEEIGRLQAHYADLEQELIQLRHQNVQPQEGFVRRYCLLKLQLQFDPSHDVYVSYGRAEISGRFRWGQ